MVRAPEPTSSLGPGLLTDKTPDRAPGQDRPSGLLPSSPRSLEPAPAQLPGARYGTAVCEPTEHSLGLGSRPTRTPRLFLPRCSRPPRCQPRPATQSGRGPLRRGCSAGGAEGSHRALNQSLPGLLPARRLPPRPSPAEAPPAHSTLT